jgi:hypothetical protein
MQISVFQVLVMDAALLLTIIRLTFSSSTWAVRSLSPLEVSLKHAGVELKKVKGTIARPCQECLAAVQQGPSHQLVREHERHVSRALALGEDLATRQAAAAQVEIESKV